MAKSTQKERNPVEVVATRDGHFGGQYRRPGDRFHIPEDKISKRWMLRADDPKAKDFAQGMGNKKVDRDQITGERVAAGGLAEQLTVTLEENRVLKQRIEELEARVDTNPKKAEPVDNTPEAPRVEEAADPIDEGQSVPRQRVRRSRS